MILRLLAQTTMNVPVEESPHISPPVYAPTIWDTLFWWAYGWPSLIYFAFLIWMVLYCLKNDPERYLWLWIILIVQPIGAVIYFVARYLPSADVANWSLVRRFKKLKQLERLRIAAAQIGNAYQFVQWGDAARDLNRCSEALGAYQSALNKEPDNLAALWGAANLEYQQGEFASALEKLKMVLDKDPAYKFGDVSLLYGKTLRDLGQLDVAKSHLEGHIPRWRQPEALYVLALICRDQGDPLAARGYLQGIIDDINASPRAIARKNLFWRSRAKRMLKRLPR
ncbi:MAG: tetratricopeptide repeat protein [Planctomycetaceae bacterium]|nr:tetratricopeptide repeat protein [Planctomycetaceae bacterium]